MHCYRLYLLCSTSLLFYEALTVPNGDWRGKRVALCNNIVGDKPYDEFAVKISTISYYSEYENKQENNLSKKSTVSQ